VILGGGPIGLLCAIEAKKYFREVVIVEKRSGYSRNNVSYLPDELIKHLKEIGGDKDLWPTGPAVSSSLSFKRLEDCLWGKAQ
jgi:2-polyprenyl-6-methoxyphenol hydroxylase-like FAD-dependent oxidoreductase